MASDKRGCGDSQQRDMGNGVEIFSRLSVPDPQAFLGGRLESGIVPFTFRSQGVDRLKSNGISLD